MDYLRQRLALARLAPASDFRDGAIEELEEFISWVEEEAWLEDWDDEDAT